VTLCSNWTAFQNVTTGDFALISNTSGCKNTGARVNVLHSNTTGIGNAPSGCHVFQLDRQLEHRNRNERDASETQRAAVRSPSATVPV
jgi:hypothetical protein